MSTTDGFAIIPDRHPEDTATAGDRPAAVFVDLEDAIEWGLRTYGPDRFRIRWLSCAVVADS